jgi:hypothetical protein
MNDNELNEMLDQWKTPPVPASLRAGIAAAAPERHGSFTQWLRTLVPTAGKGLFAGVGAAAVVSLLVVGQAFPEALGLSGPRYAMETESVYYAANGSVHSSERRSSVYLDDRWVVLAKTDTDNPLMNLHNTIFNSVHLLLFQVVPGLAASAVAPRQSTPANNCVAGDSTLVGHETVLGHSAAVVRSIEMNRTITRWMAPDLNCTTLRATREEKLPNGSFRPVERMQVVKLTANR